MPKKGAGKRVTLQDIARKTGYSLTAVSRALRNMSDIGAEATAYIQRTAREMGYVANQTAVALRYGRTNCITVIVIDLSNPFFSIMSNYIQLAAHEMGYSLMIVCSCGNPELEHQLVEQAIAQRSDGVLLFPSWYSGKSVEMLQAARVPFVLLACALSPYQADSVIIDDEQGGYIAGMHLMEAGCRKVAFLSISNSVLAYAPRCKGFLRACDEARIPLENRYLCTFAYEDTDPGQADPNSLTVLLPRLKREGVEGLFVFCDIEAWRIMASLQRSSQLSTEDFRMVSIDNIDSALVSPIPLCSVDCGLETMARRSIELLRDRIQGDDRPPQTIVCPVTLVCRNSCQAKE
ncbi:MAG: LacI family DNA-binding transcriptional regulator [Aristaeellaceae bacterium]